MSAYTEFEYDFIERTLINLENYSGEYEVTNLINCAVGLIMIPKALHKPRLNPLIMGEISEEFGIEVSDIICIKSERGEYLFENYNKYNLRNVVFHMRNAISHGGIKQRVENGLIKSLEFTDVSGENTTLEMTISVEKFRTFSIAVANMILDTKE